MKFIKLSLIVLLVAICTDMCLTYAKYDVYTYFEISAGGSDTSATWYKEDESNQTYTNDNTETTITKPCSNCKIGVRGYSNSYGSTTTGVAKMGQTVYLENSGYKDYYYLKATRIDTTLVKTKTGGTWHICT